MMRQEGFCVIDYIDDYIGVGVLSVANVSYHFLLNLMERLGLSVSQKKLIPPSTRVTCLGVLIDTDTGTISIPSEKLVQINETIQQWLSKCTCTKRQLQSIPGLLLCINKCVKPARVFLNCMLELLRSSHSSNFITLMSDFRPDLQLFAKFLPSYNGVNYYDHKNVDHVIELDACLTGPGGCVGRFVDHLQLAKSYRQCGIVQLEMVNILLAMRLFLSPLVCQKNIGNM